MGGTPSEGGVWEQVPASTTHTLPIPLDLTLRRDKTSCLTWHNSRLTLTLSHT